MFCFTAGVLTWDVLGEGSVASDDTRPAMLTIIVKVSAICKRFPARSRQAFGQRG